MKKPVTGAWSRIGRITELKNLRPGLFSAGPPPSGPTEVAVVYDLDRFEYGVTDPYGNVRLNGKFSDAERMATRWHEEVRAFFSPKAALLRQFRAEFGGTAYARSVFLRYMEEAIAQTRSEIKQLDSTAGMKNAVVRGFKFPLNGRYRILAVDDDIAPTMVASDIKTQSLMLGTVMADGHLMRVMLVRDDRTGDRRLDCGK